MYTIRKIRKDRVKTIREHYFHTHTVKCDSALVGHIGPVNTLNLSAKIFFWPLAGGVNDQFGWKNIKEARIFYNEFN